jgi:hypothetical protein
MAATDGLSPDLSSSVQKDSATPASPDAGRVDTARVLTGPAYVPPGPFTAIEIRRDLGSDGACGLRPDGSLWCWDRSGPWDPQPLPGSWKGFAIGGGVCGVSNAGELQCRLGHENWPPLQFTKVSLAPNYACGIEPNNIIACWGLGNETMALPPTSPVVDVSSAKNYTCVVAGTGFVDCWGNGSYNDNPAPGGRYTAVATTDLFACGLKTDQTIRCWGDSSNGMREVPEGTYLAVGVGGFHGCGLRTDNTIACWGTLEPEAATPPAGKFVHLAVGAAFNCALDEAGSPTCWGKGF